MLTQADIFALINTFHSKMNAEKKNLPSVRQVIREALREVINVNIPATESLSLHRRNALLIRVLECFPA